MAQASTRAIVIGVRELEKLAAVVAASKDHELHDMLDAIGAQQEDAARRRIGETKTSPDGKKWPAWSKEYAASRGPGKTLLQSTGQLRDSLTHVIDGKEAVEVGSNLSYAARHLFGDAVPGIPRRSFLDTEPGFADSRDREEIRDIVRDFLGGVLT
jgi:phage virion morphogenesis protein